MKYTVRLSPRTRRMLDHLPRDVYRRSLRKLEALETDPRPPDVRKLAGADDLFRVRVGTYRIVYSIRDRQLIVIIVRIGHRREVYR